MDQDNLKLTLRLRLLIMLLICTALCLKSISALQLLVSRSKCFGSPFLRETKRFAPQYRHTTPGKKEIQHFTFLP